MTDPTTINKYLTELQPCKNCKGTGWEQHDGGSTQCIDCRGTGKKHWHEVLLVSINEDDIYPCMLCAEPVRIEWSRNAESYVCLSNPDYLNNKSDSRDFLTFCVTEWKGWNDFLIQAPHKEQFMSGREILQDLLKKLPTLPTAVFNWSKEKEDGCA